MVKSSEGKGLISSDVIMELVSDGTQANPVIIKNPVVNADPAIYEFFHSDKFHYSRVKRFVYTKQELRAYVG